MSLTKEELFGKGWSVIKGLCPPEMVSRLNADLSQAYDECRRLQLENGVNQSTDGTVHHILGLGASYLELLEVFAKPPLADLMKDYFGGNFILNSYGGVINMRAKASYVCNMHRDVRTFCPEPHLMLNILFMLDDFTLENGATYVLSGSHLCKDRPDEQVFFAKADRVIGSAGDVLVFDSNLWHSAGINNTDQARRALTLTFTPPYLKQQMDYCRLLGEANVLACDQAVQQVLGYFSRVPSNREEWYQPPEKRFYRANQG